MKNYGMTRARLELTIALTLFFALCYAAFCGAAQEELSDDVLRLRVVAASDTQSDQAIKLAVRDCLLAELAPMQEEAASCGEMQALLRENMQRLTDCAQRTVYANGGTQRVTACLAREWYPTREYESFALPAGMYTGLQIKIGAAQGHNWWCVLYPSLCVDAAAGEEELTEDEQELIHPEGYAVRFRTAELLGELRGLLDR